jgi:hypothetical protein
MIKLITIVIYEYLYLAGVFVTSRPFQPSLIFVNKLDPTQVKHFSGVPL